jgi:hypothetical protein
LIERDVRSEIVGEQLIDQFRDTFTTETLRHEIGTLL